MVLKGKWGQCKKVKCWHTSTLVKEFGKAQELLKQLKTL